MTQLVNDPVTTALTPGPGKGLGGGAWAAGGWGGWARRGAREAA